MAWVLRFIQNCCTSKEFRETGELKCYELKESEEKLIRDTQKQFLEYQDIIKGKSVQKHSKLLPLNPVIDTEGILRCNSRLQYADYMSFDSKHPIILPRRSHVTKHSEKSSRKL